MSATLKLLYNNNNALVLLVTDTDPGQLTATIPFAEIDAVVTREGLDAVSFQDAVEFQNDIYNSINFTKNV
jgi:hypothetical protein